MWIFKHFNFCQNIWFNSDDDDDKTIRYVTKVIIAAFLWVTQYMTRHYKYISLNFQNNPMR